MCICLYISPFILTGQKFLRENPDMNVLTARLAEETRNPVARSPSVSSQNSDTQQDNIPGKKITLFQFIRVKGIIFKIVIMIYDFEL